MSKLKISEFNCRPYEEVQPHPFDDVKVILELTNTNFS